MPPRITLDMPEKTITVEATDEPGNGGAHHKYVIYDANEPSAMEPHRISFQNGGIAEHGINGITNEILLEIVKHRLNCFQAGPFACDANAVAVSQVKAALITLYERTAERRARGVEGKSIA